MLRGAGECAGPAIYKKQPYLSGRFLPIIVEPPKLYSLPAVGRRLL